MRLLQAVNQQDVEKVREILASNTKLINETDNHNFTALHHAVVKKNYEICELLMNSKKFKKTVRSHEGSTALMVGLATNVDSEIVKLLVTKEPTLVSIRNNEEVAPLHEAVRTKRLDIVKMLIESGANVNDYDLDLENALHLAASDANYKMIEYLLKETEVDPRAKNREDMNALALLLVRNDSDVTSVPVMHCFFLLLENTYDRNPVTNAYEVSDIFQSAFLSCVYNHADIALWLFHNVYSVNNERFDLIKDVLECCGCEYIFVFFHDQIERFDQFQFTRFNEINHFMFLRVLIGLIDALLTSDDRSQSIPPILVHLQQIGFKVRVKDFEEQLGAMFHGRFHDNVQLSDLPRFDGFCNYLLVNGYRMNSIVLGYLHHIVTTEVEDLNSSIIVLKILLHYATTFFDDLKSWKEVKDFMRVNRNISAVVIGMLQNFGNAKLNQFLFGCSCVVLNDCVEMFSLKHLARNAIRNQLNNDPNILCNPEQYERLGLPECLSLYLVFRE